MFAEVMMLDYMLTRWRAQPALPKKAYTSIASWQDGSAANELPLSEAEVVRNKARLRQIAPSAYYRIFPEEGVADAEPGAAADPPRVIVSGES